MTNPHNHPSAATGDAIAALAKRFWSIHPKEIQDMGITREQFYEREMRALFATLVPGEPQTSSADSKPAAWQWRYAGETEWKTPSGGRKITDEELKRERPIEQRPLYANEQTVKERQALAFYAKRKNYEPGRWVVNGLTRPVLQDGGKLARAALSLSRPQR
jgi:hypothetical protein